MIDFYYWKLRVSLVLKIHVYLETTSLRVYNLVTVSLLYKAYPNGCQHKYTFLPCEGAWLL